MQTKIVFKNRKKKFSNTNIFNVSQTTENNEGIYWTRGQDSLNLARLRVILRIESESIKYGKFIDPYVLIYGRK